MKKILLLSISVVFMSAVSFSQEKKVKSEKADAVETTYSTPEVATKAETLEKRKFLMRESQKKKNTSEDNENGRSSCRKRV